MEIERYYSFPKPNTQIFKEIRRIVPRYLLWERRKFMEDRQFFANLDTSFVNVDELVRYLYQREFVGSVFVVYQGYRGEIVFTAAKKLRVTETDEKAYLIRSGEKAFESIIARSKVSGGKISVLRSLHNSVRPGTHVSQGSPTGNVVDVGNGKNGTASKIVPLVKIDRTTVRQQPPKMRRSLAQLKEFPFDLTNFSDRDDQVEPEPDAELELMIDVSGDLLSMIDQALERAKLDLSTALVKASAEVSVRFPDLEPSKGKFSYDRGIVHIDPETDLESLKAGLGEALFRIFERLGSAPKFGKVHRFAVQRVRQLLHARSEDFEQAGFLQYIERAISIS